MLYNTNYCNKCENNCSSINFEKNNIELNLSDPSLWIMFHIVKISSLYKVITVYDCRIQLQLKTLPNPYIYKLLEIPRSLYIHPHSIRTENCISESNVDSGRTKGPQKDHEAWR